MYVYKAAGAILPYLFPAGLWPASNLRVQPKTFQAAS